VIVILAGVAGSGKSTVGALVASQLGWPFTDGDAFHSRASLDKMRAGQPLTDADRGPWLRAVAAWMDDRIAAGQSGVIACSALRRSYRDLLLAGRPAARMVFLMVSREVLVQRLAARRDHFFPRRLIDSQLAALEPPSPGGEPLVRVVTADRGAAEAAAGVIAALWPDGAPSAGRQAPGAP
jgi:gluconokinase